MSEGNGNRPPKRPRESDEAEEGAPDTFQATWDVTPTTLEPLPDSSCKIPSPVSELPPIEFDTSFIMESQPFVLTPPDMPGPSQLGPLYVEESGVAPEDWLLPRHDTTELLLPSSSNITVISASPADIPTLSDMRLSGNELSGQLFLDEQENQPCSFLDSTLSQNNQLQSTLCEDDMHLTPEHHPISVETKQEDLHPEPCDQRSIPAPPMSILFEDTLRNLHDADFTEVLGADDVSFSTEFDQFFDAVDDGHTTEHCFEDCPPDDFYSDPSDEAESHQEADSEENKEEEPLYPGAKVSVSECSVAFLSLMLGCNISGQLLSTILSFILLILPEGSKFFSSLHLFLNQFKYLQTPVKFTFYCSVCFRSLLTKDSVCPRCDTNGTVAYYLNFPIIPQIQALYSNSKFVEALSYRFNRSKIEEGNLEDIYDGELYKSVGDILNEPYNTSLMWNSDGISIYKSSNFQIHPFYFVFNELPPHLRYREEYMILAGLAFGYEKPNCNIFLKPISDECELLREGISVTLPSAVSPTTVKIIVLCGTCDAPAKSLFMRMNNFNGFHGCPRCLARGQKSDLSENVFVYPYEENFVKRNVENYQEHLQTVRENGAGKDPVFGIKGPTYLFKIVYTFFMTSTAVDVMHNVYLGVCRQMFFLWFSTPFLKKVFGDSAEKKKLIETLSAILVNMNAPHYFSRPPRSLLHVKYFKAAEFRSWLFNTALPLLEKYMKEPYLGHFKKFVCAIFLLNQASVSLQDVEVARSLLHVFVRDFQELYGVRNMSFNVHCLLHLADNTLLLGPLFVSSCFGFESLNGRLARLVHGTRHAGLQIYAHLGLLRNLSPLVASLKNPNVKKFCEAAIYKSQHLKVAAKIESGLLVIGNFVREHVLPPDFSEVLCNNSDIGSNFSFFFRLKKHPYLYVAQDYGRGERNSACVQYRSNDHLLYGSVKVFVKTSQCMCSQICAHNSTYHALIQRYDCNVPFETVNPTVPITSIMSYTITSQIDKVTLQDLLCVCFEFSVDSSQFVTVPLNPSELE